ncbi:DsrE/DsrF-like family protein [Anatilimnocola aggregata]|uniref:DsrE/DsrF-like family protein n=1 Tax=Anatilimnocola aggregata TaxID=2528021 RepID=A0A517YE82_9BACT|nr:DsrE family protein [Anatilimnocola aggregata]QDU28530.1 DsrE/DsrF-like family protein [Anatilimnocola aggregata]
MRGLALVFAGLVSVATYGAVADGPAFVFPQIARFGGIVRTPEAAEPPRRGAKIVFDIVADSKHDELNKGLESVARYLNLNAEAGHKPADVKLALVLHGSATKAALGDTAYAKHTAATKNPNLELIHELKACGVEVFVCGQSLARNKFAAADVAGDVAVAVSAMTVNANKQFDGYAYISIH